MLVVRGGGKATQPPPPLHGVRLWKDIEKTCGRKHPRAPPVKWLWKEKSTEAVLAFLRDTRVGCISTRRKPPEEYDGGVSGGEGEEGVPGPP